ncbi:hypothetical protein OG21DRAFT_1595966 [Imleria badia]|nr:hypothetical protein OG21DRAFT_1595966 [Imleria badia]
MSNNARALFLAAIVLYCILRVWSQNKPSFDYQLSKRFVEAECRPLDIELASDQCTHVRDLCPTSETVLSIPYLQLYYCGDPPVRPFIFTALILWLVFLFSTLGISAADFFTPNLAAIAQFLGLNEDVAGVTLLAFGNASPDVFATFSAMRANSGGLAIGELLGAASFIVSCVAGSMCIIRPFKVDRIPFLRDVGFFTIAVCILLFILRDGMITAFESTLLIVWYVFYAFTVIVGGWWSSRRERKRRIEASVRAEYMEDSPLQPYSDESPTQPSSSSLTVPLLSPIPIRTRSASAPNIPRVQTQLPPAPHSRTPSPISSPSHLAQMPSFSLVGAIEFRQVVSSLQSQAATSSLSMFDSPVTPYAGGHYHAPRRHSRSSSVSPRPLPESDEWDGALGLPLNDRSPKLLRTSITEEPEHERAELLDIQEEEGARTPLSIPTIPSISHTPASPTAPLIVSLPMVAEAEEQIPPTTRPRRLWYVFARTWHILFPSLHHFKSKTLTGKIVSLLATPAVMALTVTLPVVITPYGDSGSHLEKLDQHDTRLPEFEEEGAERALIAEHEIQEDLHEVGFNKWLTAAQCILGPLLCVVVLFSRSSHIKWLLAGTVLGGSLLALLVLAFSNMGSHPTAQMARCSMGFLVSVVWIMAIADEVVNVLQVTDSNLSIDYTLTSLFFQTFGFIFGLSDAIIGLTIFAVGNSLADLVANTSVAVFAPMMGFSACFGGPMVNILLGIGISGTYVINESGGAPYDLHFTPTLITSTVGLLMLLVTTLVVVPMKGYVLSRRWGVFLILAYVVLMSANVAVEMSFE